VQCGGKIGCTAPGGMAGENGRRRLPHRAGMDAQADPLDPLIPVEREADRQRAASSGG
jgi:hypothetical protein